MMDSRQDPNAQAVTFSEVTLGDVITLQRGFDITKAEQSDGQVPIVSSSGISSFHNKWKVKGPGVVIGRKGTLGTVHYLSENFWPHDTTLWVKDFKGSNPAFVARFLKTLRLENFDAGASNPSLNRNHVHKIRVLYANPGIQRKIAAVLSLYDDLIDNNRRRIALLERMAEQLYREWFVRFRFPGHKQARFEKGVASGWLVTAASDIFNVMSGGTPNTDTSAYWNGDIPFFTPKDAHDSFYVLDTEKHLSISGLAACNSQLYPKDTIFITARGTVGKIALAHVAMAMNQSCYALAPKQATHVYFHYLALMAATSWIKGVANSGVFSNIVVDTFKIVPILMPPDDLISQFNELVRPMFDQAGSLQSANILLERTRDILLPRLISGKLRVDDLDIQFPPGMQEPA